MISVCSFTVPVMSFLSFAPLVIDYCLHLVLLVSHLCVLVSSLLITVGWVCVTVTKVVRSCDTNGVTSSCVISRCLTRIFFNL